MKSSSLESKTIRPGLAAYSFYASNRQPVSRAQTAQAKPVSKRHHRRLTSLILFGLLVFALFKLLGQPLSSHPSTNTGTKANTPPSKSTPAIVAPTSSSSVSQCANNSLPQFMTVSISQRHLWACEGTKVVYNTPVVTGIESLAADKTPLGTYQIYAKQTDTTLTGSDTTGSWSDPVSYWMPFLNNQYGTYGLHDATWRPNSAFGNIDPNSLDASHGCVELPLGAAQWLYNWSQVGTTVTIES